MKKEKGFTLVELIVAMAILTLVTVPIFKAFLVSTKVNVKSFEKDKANIEVTNKIEEIKKNPSKFIEAHKDKTETRYYTSLFSGAYYYCLEDKSLGKYNAFDDKSFEDYVKTFFKANPGALGFRTSAGNHKNTLKNNYNSTKYYDKATFKDLLNGKGTELSRIKSIINKCSITEYYDSNWNVIDEAHAKYQEKIEVSRKAENEAKEIYNPETLFKGTDRYNVPSNENYFTVLCKDKEGEGDKDDIYYFWIFYGYTSEDFERDLLTVYKTITPEQDDLSQFLQALSRFQNLRTKDEEDLYKIQFSLFYSVFSKYKYDINATPKRVELDVPKDKIIIPVRIDFNYLSIKPMYNINVYNTTKKSMELYIVHNGNNDSKVAVKVSKGKSKQTETYTTKNFAKTIYKIDVKVKRKEDNYNLIDYKTEKYVSGEEAQDFNFVDK